jgi:2-dehydro-3-deoxyphosphogluconate aldolase/(4S)-4-hydroxy-2-oxoglutarate aldolase
MENPVDLVDVARALREGGVKFFEITMTIPGALDLIGEAAQRLGDDDLHIGAGTVLDAETARLAILAGAGFVVAPTFDQAVVDLCHAYGIAVMPGAMTPTEILRAWKGGADAVKIFPAHNVGGPDFLKAVKEPLPQIELLPTKGVDFETAGAYIRAGAIAVGVGSALLSKKLLAAKDYAAISENARRMIDIVRAARSGSPG